MSVYKPKGSPYFHFDFQFRGQRYYGSTGQTSKRAAEAYERRQRHAAALPEQQREAITLSEAAGLYQDHAEALPSWPTIEYMLNELVEGIGQNRLLSQITQRDLQVFFAGRRDGRSNASVNREIENARAVWRRAETARFDVGEMPNWGALFFKVPRKPPRELEFEEEDSLFEHLRSDVRDAVDFLLKSGWRRGEVLGLRWSDVSFPRKQATTRIKGGDTVTRPLTTSLIEILARQPVAGPYVFTYVCQKTKPALTDKKGVKRPARVKGERYPLTPTALRKPFAQARADAKVEGFRLHDLRHTRGTRIVRSTGSLAAAKEALKHRRIETTLRYAHVLDEDVRNALDASESRNSPEVPNTEKRKA